VTPPAIAARTRAAAGAAASPAPLRRPTAPRRVSGPARHPRAVPLGPRSSPGGVVRLLDSPFLDRLIRGRTWIAIVAFALLGIVAMQVAILRLGASIGASVTQIEHLSQSNQAAETQIAQAEPGRDVASEATSLGMVYPPAGNLVYLRFAPGDAAVAATSYSAPTAPLFTSAAASLTAPLDTTDAPGAVAASTSTTTNTTAATPASSTTTTSAATSTTPSSTAPTSSGGAVTAPAATPSSSAIGAAGGSTAPATGATG
jgi:hypothetical protein